MSDYTDLAKTIVGLTKGKIKKSPKGYDTKGIVNRVDTVSKKAYVHFYGGVDETPVDLTINCSKGDIVQVRVSGGRAWIVGNQTAPPTDDKAVNILKHTVNNLQTQMNDSVEKLEEEIEEIEPGEGKLIERIATEYILSTSNIEIIPYDDMEWSEELPEWVSDPRTYFWKRIVIYYTDGTIDEQDPILDANAQISAEADFAISSENNHFWHDSSGAWVTEVDQEDYISDPTQGGYANRVTNAGILQTYNGNLLTAWTGSGVSFFDGSGSTAATSKMLAAFYSSGITFDTTTPFTIGNTNSYIKWINTGTDLSPNWKLQINADTIQFGGTDIEDATAKYIISTNVDSVTDTTTAFSPANLVVNFLKEGAAYDGRFIFKTSSNGSSWTTKYTSSSDEHYRSFALGAYYGVYSFFKIEMYEAGGTSNLLTEKTIPVIANGEEGTGIDETTITYATSSSYSTPPSSGWQSTPPYVSQGYYLWTKTIFSYSDGTSSDPVYSVARQGVNGTDGEDFLYNQYMEYSSSGTYPGLRFYAGNKSSSTYSSTFSLMKNDGLHIYTSSNEIAYFTSSGAVIKSSSTDKYIYLNSNALSFYNTNALCGSLEFSSYAASTSEGNYLNISTNYNHSYTADIKVSTNTYTSRASVALGAPGNYGVDLDIYCTPNNLDNNYGILSLYDNIRSTTSQELLAITANGDVKLCGHREHIGFTNEQSTTTALTLTTSWANTGAYLDLWKGVYVIEAQITISQTSSDTVIGMRIANTTDSVTYGKSTVAIEGNNTNLTTVAIVSIDDISSKSSTSRYYIQVRKTQSTSSTVKISAAGLKAVRIA